MLEFCDVTKLRIEDYIQIYHASSRELKRQILLHAVGIERVDDEDEPRKSIILDYCLDLIAFVSNQGFSWESVHTSVTIGMRLLDSTACKGIDVEQATQVFTDEIMKETEAFTNAEVKALIDYFLSTLFRHYHLYLFCMIKEQELDQRMCELEVEAPFVPEQLSKAMAIEKWNYEQSLKKIDEEREQQQMMRLDDLKSKIEQLDQEKKDTLNDLNDMRENENIDELPALLGRLTALHVKSAESEIQNSMLDSRENMEMRMKKAAVTKPASSKRRVASRQRAKSRQKK